MATPTRHAFRLPADPSRHIEGWVLTAGVERPAVVVCGDPPLPLAERLARAGLSVVQFDGAAAGALSRVLAALRDGALGLRPRAVGLLGHAAAAEHAIVAAKADAGVRALVTWAAPRDGAEPRALAGCAPWLSVDGDPAALEPTLAATVAWFGRHLIS